MEFQSRANTKERARRFSDVPFPVVDKGKLFALLNCIKNSDECYCVSDITKRTTCLRRDRSQVITYINSFSTVFFLLFSTRFLGVEAQV